MSEKTPDPDGYQWNDASFTSAHEYLLPPLEDYLAREAPDPGAARILDLGCGNGAVTNWLAEQGYEVVGVDPSTTGIRQARAAYPDVHYIQASAYAPLPDRLGTFSIVVSLEVIEHLYDPVQYASTVFDLLAPAGTAILSTPYHGWCKNVLIAGLGRFDEHVEPLRVHGHIKFWSPETLTRLLEDTGFEVRDVEYAGRIRPVAKSMLVVASRPVDSGG